MFIMRTMKILNHILMYFFAIIKIASFHLYVGIISLVSIFNWDSLL